MKFFVTGMGRSGTKWLAALLNRNIDTVPVMHEIVQPFDAKNYAQSYKSRELAFDYIRRRDELLKNKGVPHSAKIGEVNSYLRYSIDPLMVYYGCPIIAIIRNGMDVVNSLVERSASIPPAISDDAPTKESAVSFYAWYWADTYRKLLEQRVPIFRLEDLIDCPRHLDIVCSIIGINVPHDEWAKLRNKKINAGKNRRHVNWTSENIDFFMSQAYDIEEIFGYL